MFGKVGLVFDFENTADETISPLCYYPTDGWTGARTNSGCGPIGVKWSPTPFSSKGYADNDVVLPSFDEMDDERNDVMSESDTLKSNPDSFVDIGHKIILQLGYF